MVRRQFRFITDGRTRRAERGPEWRQASTSRGDDTSFKCLSYHDCRPRLNTCRQPKNMRTDDALDHTVSPLLTFVSSFSSRPSPLRPASSFYFTIPSFHTGCVYEFAVQACSPLARSSFYTFHTYTCVWRIPSLGYAEPRGRLGVSVPGSIPIMLLKVRPW